MNFPIPFIPTQDWRGGRGFGADRSKVAKKLNTPGGQLKHGACDLVVPAGTPVLAMDDGVVLKGPYEFFLGTYALEIQHSTFIARYCEIDRKTEFKDRTIKSGQVIGYVGGQPGGDMLHLEMYDGSATGELTAAKIASNGPYFRRADLMDPTSTLDALASTAAPTAPKKYEYTVDADGRKFLK